MSAPSAANANACARPCPRAPPVIKATRPSNAPIAGQATSRVAAWTRNRLPRALFRSAPEQRRQDLDQEVAASSRRERVKAVAEDGSEIEITGDVEAFAGDGSAAQGAEGVEDGSDVVVANHCGVKSAAGGRVAVVADDRGDVVVAEARVGKMAIRAIVDGDVPEVARGVTVAAKSFGALEEPVAVVAEVDGYIVVAVVAQSGQATRAGVGAVVDGAGGVVADVDGGVVAAAPGAT